MRLRFTKMHGLGNDFVVIDAINQQIKLSPKRIKRLTDRRFGVGCDQVLLVEPPMAPDVDFHYRIFNHDGSEVENCGNGARCFAKFVQQRKLTGKSDIVVETCNGRMTLMVQNKGGVTVNMGKPELVPDAIPFIVSEQKLIYPLLLRDGVVEINAISMGNPHAVIIVDDIANAPVTSQGPEIETHRQFPKKANVGFMAIRSRSEIDLRVYERGVGETLACGTGACAAVVAGRLRSLLDDSTKVNLPGGSLLIEWKGGEHPVMMTGPAETIFHGQITL